MKPLPLLLLLTASFASAADDAPRPQNPDQGPRPEGRPNFRLPVPLSPDEQKRLHEAMEKAKQDPAVKEAHELAAKAQQAAAEAQKKAHELAEEAARKADPEVAPILEKIRKAMEKRQPNQNSRQPEGQPRGESPRQREGGNRQPNGEPNRQREVNREQPVNRIAPLPGLTPDEQQRVREAMAKANAEPAVREAREAAALAQRKAIEIAEDAALKADPSVAPLFEKMHKAAEARRPEGDAQRGRKQPE
jgi:hypothetical protein